MKKSISRVLSLMLAVFVAFGMICVSTGEAKAASGPLKLDKQTFWAKDEAWGSAPVVPVNDDDWELIDSAKLVSVKSSKPAVLKAVKDGTNLYGYYLMPKKVGKSKITIKYKVNGKTYTMSRTYTVKKYPNPYESIKVNGKSVKISSNKFFYDVTGYSKSSCKIKITPKSGWKVVNAYASFYNPKTEKDKFKNLKASVVTKGTAIKIPSGYEAYVFATLENTKGETIDYGVRFFK